MKYLSMFFVYLSFVLIGNAQADNFNYCYSKENGLDQECLARKNANTEYYRNKEQSARNHRSDDYDPPPPGPNNYDANGRFVPTPIPQRQQYIVPGMY